MGCAITGGVFFEPENTNYPQEYIGKYFFMDYCGNWINVIDPATGKGRKTFAANTAEAPIAIDVHPDGNLYYLTRQNGTLYKIVYAEQAIPVINKQPELIKVTVGSRLTIEVEASGAAALNYSWTKDGSVKEGERTNTLMIPAVQWSDSGTYVVKVSNTLGETISKPMKVQVLPYNVAPVVSILPLSGHTFQAGQTFTITGLATDAEEGELPAAAYTWSVDLHHGTHIHDGLPVTGKKGIDFTVPVEGGHTETNVFYRVTLIARDANGASDTAYIDLQPEVADITIQSDPSGLQFTLDGIPYTAPHTFSTITGAKRKLGALSPQAVQNTNYVYTQWSHSPDSVNDIHPVENSVYTVSYKNLSPTNLHEVDATTFRIFPNPFSEATTISSTEAGKVTLLDALGNTLTAPALVKEGDHQINLPVTTGLYFLLFDNGVSQHRIKLMKK